MSNWEIKKIGKMVNVSQGLAINAQSKHLQTDDVSQIPLLRIADLQSGAKVQFIKKNVNERFIAQPEDIIYTRTGRVGLVFRGRYGVVHNNCFKVNPIDKCVNRDFLFWLLNTQHIRDFVNLLASGAAQPDLTHSKFKQIKTRIPDLLTQEKIANVLSTYDKLIGNNNRRIEVLEQTAEEVYKEWFVRMRFPGYENMKFDKGIPEGWELKKVDDIISFDIGGGWGKDSPEEGFTEEAHVIRGTDIPNMKYGEINYELLRFHKGSQLRNRRLQSSDIIFEASGGSKDQRLGRTYYITDETLAMYDDDVICASFCKLIRIDEKYLSWYFNNYLNYAYKTETLSIFEVQSTGISNFGFTKFKKHHQVLLPPADLMKHFFELTYSMYIEEQRLGRKNQNLKIQRDLLLLRLMNGTIEVK